MLTVPQAARKAGMSEGAVRAAIHEGELPAERVGNAFGIMEDDLEAWLESAEADDEDEDDTDGEDDADDDEEDE